MNGARIDLYMALVHYPVLNRNGEVIASAITNLDLHDMARLACTYGLNACYVVTPLEDQRELVKRLISHWCEGVGRELMTDRAHALRRLRLSDVVETAIEEIERECGRAPIVWATSARVEHRFKKPQSARHDLEKSGKPGLMLFGTGWGLASSLMDTVDEILQPITGCNGYNHLSVRCAAAILLDRFFRKN